ncbi:MAG: hypothetical protein ACLUPK_02345 [Veillonella sp.]
MLASLWRQILCLQILHATAVGLGAGASVTGDKAVGFVKNAAAAGGYSIAIGSNSKVPVLTVHKESLLVVVILLMKVQE